MCADVPAMYAASLTVPGGRNTLRLVDEPKPAPARPRSGSTIMLAPPLIISREDLDWALDQRESVIGYRRLDRYPQPGPRQPWSYQQ